MAVHTIGSTSPAGAANNGVGAPGALWVCKRALAGASNAKWTALRAYISGAGDTRVILLLYNDLSNSPNNLVAWGELSVPLSAPAAEYTFTLPGTAPAPNGNYWLGTWVASGVSPATWFVTSGGTQAYLTTGYGTPPDPLNETGIDGTFDLRVAADATDGAAGSPGPRGLLVDTTGALLTVTSGAVSLGAVVAGWPTDASGQLVTAASGLVAVGTVIPGLPTDSTGALVIVAAADGTPFGAVIPGLLTDSAGRAVAASGAPVSMLNGLPRLANGGLALH